MIDSLAAPALCELHDAGLFDLDGVLYRGAAPVAHAAEALAHARTAGMACVFVTNNASRPRAAVAAQLTDLSIEATAEDILSSAHIGVELAEAQLGRGASVLLCGGEGLREAATEAGLHIVESADEHPAGVIHGFSPETNWQMLSEAVLAINAGARYIATNLDRVIPRERGLMIGMGSFAKAITHATGVEPISGAKPDAHMFSAAARKAGARCPLVVGDNLDTDILGATNSGLPSLHVLTGTHSAREVCLATPELRPRYLGDDLRCLCEPYPDVLLEIGSRRLTLHADGHRLDHAGILAALCGTATSAAAHAEYERIVVSVASASAVFDGGKLTVVDTGTQGTISLDAYRALAHLAWIVADCHPVLKADLARYINEMEVQRHE